MVFCNASPSRYIYSSHSTGQQMLRQFPVSKRVLYGSELKIENPTKNNEFNDIDGNYDGYNVNNGYDKIKDNNDQKNNNVFGNGNNEHDGM